MIKSKRDAFAQHMMFDYAETEDYRYHYGHTTQPVWATDGLYICVTKHNQKPAKHRNNFEWDWNEVRNDLVNKDGYKIWESLSK